MAKIRIDEVLNRTTEQVNEAQAPVKRRKELHKTSQFEQSPETFAGIGRPDLSALKPGAAAAPSRIRSRHPHQDGETTPPTIPLSPPGRGAGVRGNRPADLGCGFAPP